MGGRWGGTMPKRRHARRDRRRNEKPVPDMKVERPAPRGALVAGIGFYILALAGALLLA